MKKFKHTLKTVKALILGWAVIIPLIHLLPLKKNLVLFIGKNNGSFFDNVKYLYLYLHRLNRKDIKYYFFTEKQSVYNMLKCHNLPVLFHPTLRSIYALACSNIIISCNMAWIKNYKYHLSVRAKKIQLWHGVPLKKIGMLVNDSLKKHNSLLARIDNAIRGKNCIHDLFLSTSDYFTVNIFSKAMRAKRFIELGYPRNSIFFKGQLDKLDFLDADVQSLEKITEFQKKGFKCVCYAPTWDDPMGNAIQSGYLDLKRLSKFAQEHKILFVFKFHPSINCKNEFGLLSNIIYYNSSKDIQPLLRVTDILVTDYSSVYMDYLLLNRPIIFFPYNLDGYLKAHNGLLFDFNSMAPGPKCYSQEQLHEAILDCTAGQKDDFADDRGQIRKLAFKYEDGRASERIWDFIMKEYMEVP
ncbi:putative CDP-glycerol:poly(Glycerophosphate) glycerophosphotransferase [uncultured Desulfobacterium sp.]|uniref:Putative CDP-glycerol:poly(Glycerophosphate) glycerophosphotransferase n=1 Tax=uncultured Desulfobacterium sp. TaxID=201089 RepID=A0A445MS27_9BACT|nr:putative CDP-glycerol:poly(Glycerophosphate) glycerophosphotransferase [uncultured Desulfobacterium sp.]